MHAWHWLNSLAFSVQGPLLPSVRVARKAATLEAVRLLHQAGELNDHLKPVEHKEEDSDEDDEHKMEIKRVPHAGKKRRVQYYLNQVG